MVNYLSRYGWDYLNPAAQNAQEVVSTDPRLYGLSGAIGLSPTDSGLNPQMTRPVKQWAVNPADYADEPQSSIGRAIDDYRAGKRDDTPAMLGSAAANIGMMPLRMMTLEGMAGLAKDAGRIAQIPYNVLTSPEPVSTAQMIQPAADMAMMAPLGGVAAGKVAPAGKVAYSNSKEGALPGLMNAGGERQGIGSVAGHPSGAHAPNLPLSAPTAGGQTGRMPYSGPQGQGGHSSMPHDPSLDAWRASVAEDIAKRIAEADLRLNHFGLRAESGREFRNGEYLPPSRVWDDGVPHPEDTLSGTSTLGLPYDQTITHADVTDAMRALGNYDGDSLVLVGGKTAEHGVDAGESVLRGATALGQWPRYKDGNALFSNSKEGAVPGLLRSASAGEQMQQPGITAYHGSPHDFDRFSMDKIGTGEGAQAYGHGLYFAEREGVAKSYKEALGGTRLKDGTPFDETNPHHLAANALADADGNRATAIAGLKGSMQAVSAVHEGGYRQRLQRAIGVLERGGTVPEMDLGHMYEVRINADPEHFLDWDKPLSQQSEKVKEFVDSKMRGASSMADKKLGDDPTGQAIWEATRNPFVAKQLGVENWSQAGGSPALRDAGIPGIKYLDQGSRTAGEGSRNFVVFDDKLVSIVKKYGWAGAAAMLGISADDLVSQAQAQGF